MATPANTSTELTLAKVRNELATNSYGTAYTAGETSLYQASIGTYGTINTANASADRPDGSPPHSLSEFYNYDHDLSSSLHETTLTRGSTGGYGFANSGYWGQGNFGSLGDDTFIYNSRAVTIFRLYTFASSSSATTGNIILDITDDLNTTSPPNSGWTTMSIYNSQSDDSGSADHTLYRTSASYTSYGSSSSAGARWTWSVSSSGTPTVFNKYWGSSDNTVNYVVLE